MEKLARPPIEQAAIEVIVDLPPGHSFADLELVARMLDGEYPQKTDMRRQAIEVKFQHLNVPKGQYKDLGQFGWQLFSKDGRRNIQLRLDGVLLTQSGPYEDWESCYTDFGKAISAYFRAMAPTRVRRASSRFINKLVMAQDASIEGILQIPVPLPSGFEEVKIANMISRVTFTDPASGLLGTVILMADGVSPVLVLDIDVADLEPGPLDSDKLKGRFDRLREFKNRLFQNSLTKQQLEVYR
jgi:uncharacterized protein (TIGR04255 family)